MQITHVSNVNCCFCLFHDCFLQLWRIYWKLRHSPAVNTPGVLSCPWRFPAVPESWQVWGWPKWKQGPWFTACPAVYNKPRQNAICLASSLFKPKENILHFIFKSPVYQARVLRLFRRGWKAVPGVSYSGVSRTGCSSVAGDTWLSSQRGLFFALREPPTVC